MKNTTHTFNTLPAKPEYLEKVRKILNACDDASERDLVSSSGLTKTQALCAINELIKLGEVQRDNRSKKYKAVKNSNS